MFVPVKASLTGWPLWRVILICTLMFPALFPVKPSCCPQIHSAAITLTNMHTDLGQHFVQLSLFMTLCSDSIRLIYRSFMSFYLPVHLSWLLLPLLRIHTSVIHSIFSYLCRRNWFWHSTPPHQQPVNTFGNVLWKIRHFTSESHPFISLSLSLFLLHTLCVCVF